MDNGGLGAIPWGSGGCTGVESLVWTAGQVRWCCSPSGCVHLRNEPGVSPCVSCRWRERERKNKETGAGRFGGQGFNSAPHTGHFLFHIAARRAPTTVPTMHLHNVSYFVDILIEALCFFSLESHSTHWVCEAWGPEATSEETLEGGWATILINKVNVFIFFRNAGECVTCNQETGYIVEADKAAGCQISSCCCCSSSKGKVWLGHSFFSSVKCWQKQMNMLGLDQRAEETAGSEPRCHQASLLFGSGRRFNLKSSASRLHFQSSQLFSETFSSRWAVTAMPLVPCLNRPSFNFLPLLNVCASLVNSLAVQASKCLRSHKSNYLLF